MTLKRPRKNDKVRIACSHCRSSRTACKYSSTSTQCERCFKQDLECDLEEAREEFVEKASAVHDGYDIPSLRSSVAKQQPEASVSKVTSEWEGLLAGTYKIAIGIDLGTKYSSGSYQVVPKGAKVLFGETIDLRHVRDGSTHRIPTELAVLRDEDQLRLISGAQVSRELQSMRLSEKEVFRLIKIALIPDNEINFKEDAEMIRSVKDSHELALSSIRGKVVVVRSEYSKRSESRTINNMKDIIREYLRFLWDKIKLDIADNSGMTKEALDEILRDTERTKISIGTTAAWTNDMLDELHELALEAEMPNATLVAEARCALIEVAQEYQRRLRNLTLDQERGGVMEQLLKIIWLIVDIGCGTAVSLEGRLSLTLELSGLGSYHLFNNQRYPKIRNRRQGEGPGSLWGASRLVELFRKRIEDVLGPTLDKIAASIQDDISDDSTRLSRAQVIDAFARGFEEATHSFAGDEGSAIPIYLSSGDKIDARIIREHGWRLDRRNFYLSVGEMKAIFDEYLEHIFQLIDNQIASLEAAGLLKDHVLKMVKVGGGTLPPYIGHKLQERYQDIEISGRENNQYSMVAKGAFFTAVDEKLGEMNHARCSYGTELIVRNEKDIHGADCPLLPIDPRSQHEKEIAGCAVWGIKYGHSLHGSHVHGWIQIDAVVSAAPLYLPA